MLNSVTMLVPSNIEIDSPMQPISGSRVLGGAPTSRSKVLVRSRDLAAHILVWECTAGRFNWYYEQDESVVVVSGEAFLVNESGEERRFGPGDVGFFPAGTHCTWRVPGDFRKVAVVREAMWRPVGVFVKTWNKILRAATRRSGETQKTPSELRMRVEHL